MSCCRRSLFLLTPPRGGRLIPVYWIRSSFLRFLLTPPRGGRQTCGSSSLQLIVFLLTPPRGGRPHIGAPSFVPIRISTHAPAWGATSAFMIRQQKEDYFYSRPRVGGDCRWPVPTARPARFLLTPPRGGRRQFFTSTRQVCDTNCRKIHSNSNFLSICPCDF